jgi:nucleoside-diphosphate-sugar epimerase
MLENLLSKLPNGINTKILITGATGLVGKSIIENLISLGFQKIIATYHRQQPYDLPHIKWYQCNLLDVTTVYDVVSDTEIVIHAAAEVSFSIAKRSLVIHTSKVGTENVVNACLEHHVSKLIHVSSVAAIGRSSSYEHISETNIFGHSPYDTTYGLAKFLAEQEVWRGHAEGLNVAILNPSTIIGDGTHKGSSMSLFEKIKNRKLPYYPMGTTGWVSVLDVAKASIRCMDPEINGSRYIISSENMTYKEAFGLIAESMHMTYSGKVMSNFYFSVLKKWSRFIELFVKNNSTINSETLMSTSVTSLYDHSKSIKELGISYIKVKDAILSAGQAYSK